MRKNDVSEDSIYFLAMLSTRYLVSTGSWRARRCAGCGCSAGCSKIGAATLIHSTLAVSRVAIVKPENAHAVEEHIIRLARSGKLADKIDENTLIRMLDDVGKLADQHSGGVKKVTIQRKKRMDDDSDDEDF